MCTQRVQYTGTNALNAHRHGSRPRGRENCSPRHGACLTGANGRPRHRIVVHSRHKCNGRIQLDCSGDAAREKCNLLSDNRWSADWCTALLPGRGLASAPGTHCRRCGRGARCECCSVRGEVYFFNWHDCVVEVLGHFSWVPCRGSYPFTMKPAHETVSDISVPIM